ncbi:unnamed protein product [Aspergillus oryzae]|uniref:Unnamed protein product n=1 Tax=Aspergillus oryzae TaxID=5062 RepID=A0AAN4YVY5_ASPOZ|nr:unnamed protein product [Aspergillus oryzae]GMF87852.1 unnamed protein product [Aspergillus oryzae]GMG34408.1 unnamed protein product [Aspergillus oryzae]
MGFPTAPKPKTLLGLHRILSPSAGVKVSPICLGGISIGNEWRFYTGKNEEPFKLLDAFYDMGGNFIDTASNYNNQTSETLIGQWMEERGVRDQMVIATKYTAGYRAFSEDPEPLQTNFTGNSAKSMHVSVRDSLKKLRTDYIDLLYVHWWDYATPVEEVMRGLHVLVMQGKGNWNAAFRDMEGDVIPMCEDQDMAIVSYGSLGTGALLTVQQRKEREADPDAPMGSVSDIALKTSEVLEKIADRKGTTLQAISTFVFPIVGVNTVEHIKAMPDALKVKLSKEEIDDIHAASPYSPGYPMTFTQYMQPVKYDLSWTPADNQQYQMSAWIDAPPKRLVEPHDIHAELLVVEVAGADEIVAHARVREEVEPGMVGDGLLEFGRAESEGDGGGGGEAGTEEGEGGDCVVVHPFVVFGHAEGGHDGGEGAEDVHFGEGEEVVGGWGAEDVALVGSFAEEVEEGGGLVGGGTV